MRRGKGRWEEGGLGEANQLWSYLESGYSCKHSVVYGDLVQA